MKKLLFILCMAILAGCSSDATGSTDKPEVKSTYNQMDSNIKIGKNDKLVEHATFRPADVIFFHFGGLSKDLTYSFGGFSSNNQFAVNMILNEGYETAVSETVYYFAKEGKVITLPDTNVLYRIDSFNIEEDSITLTKVKKDTANDPAQIESGE